MKIRLLEICVCNLEDACQAAIEGADRLELCEDLSVGGLTPSVDWAKEARQELKIPIHILIRPRAGNFIYSKIEKNIILSQVDSFLAEGFEGVVLGALNLYNLIDIDFMKNCIQRLGEGHGCFHKAIDAVHKPSEQVNLIRDLGFKTILSSGGKANVINGISELKAMQEMAQNQIEIMPGGGLRSNNIQMVLEELNPNCLHSAARTREGIFNKTEVHKMAQKLR